MSDQLAPDGGQQEPQDNAPAESQERQQQSGFDPDYMDKLNSRLDEIGGHMSQLYEAYASMMNPPEDEGYADDDYDETEYEDDQDDTDPEAERRRLERALDKAVQERLAPHLEQQQIEKRDSAFNQLTERYPELDNEEQLAPIVEAAYEMAQRMTGQDNPRQVVNSPLFVQLVEKEYKARKADERAAQETPAGQRQDPYLESGGRVATDGSGEDEQERLVRLWSEEDRARF